MVQEKIGFGFPYYLKRWFLTFFLLAYCFVHSLVREETNEEYLLSPPWRTTSPLPWCWMGSSKISGSVLYAVIPKINTLINLKIVTCLIYLFIFCNFQTYNILAPMMTHGIYSGVILGHGLWKIHDHHRRLRRRIERIRSETTDEQF